MINKDKIVRTNRVFGGVIYNSDNLDFDIEQAKKQKNIFKKLAQVSRAMLSGHSFTDGNKRTSFVMIKCELNELGIKCDYKKLVKTLIKLAKTQESDVNKIERRIRKCQIKNIK